MASQRDAGSDVIPVLTGARPDARDVLAGTGSSHVPILVVDDNAGKRLAVRAVLEPLGYPIVEAASGVEALRCLMVQDFAVILLDVCMPLMDGFETAELIRQRRESEMTPIIFFTAFGSDDLPDTDRYAQGAVDFMFAPVPPHELRAKVSVFAHLFMKAQDLATQARGVQTSADQLRLLTDAAPIGIFQTDAQNCYVYTNPRWSELFGISAEEAAGKPWHHIIDASERARLGARLAESDAGQGDLWDRFEVQITGAISRVVLVTSRVIEDGHGGTMGWVGTVSDVTIEAGARTAMSHARDRADEASQLKSDFLTNMSHEIRTPMNGVIGMTDLLLETQLDDGQRDYAQTVRDSGVALLTVIDDILDFSKIEAGKLEIEDVEFSVPAVVHDLVDLLRGIAQVKGLEVVIDVDASVPVVVSGDPGRVRQILTNLVGNALKFTRAGRIVVRVDAAAGVAGESVIRFEVTDSGDGIAADKLDLVFQPFVQADTSTSRRYGGTGLGLAISSQLVALMGGDCGVSSEQGVGSCFWFTIRVGEVSSDHLTAPGALPPEASSLASPSDGDRQPRLLLAEDNPINQKVAVAMLSGAGYAVDAVINGAEAVQAAAAGDYDAILMDCQMPELNGYEATAAIRAHEGARRHTPIIALTAGAGRDERSRCLAEGMDSYLSKPVSKDVLLAMVGQLVRFGAPTAGAVPGVGHASATELTIDQLVVDELRAVGAAAEVDLFGDLVHQFFQDTEPELVELRDALGVGDRPKVSRIAHNIKGSSGQLGGRRLSLACGRLERKASAGLLADVHSALHEVELEYRELCSALTQQVSTAARRRASVV
ncbi:MAG: domain S-box [Acidimicrobiales bacterium]|nr:domain S-box [Acidimicrobiales bacterium]